MINPAGNTYKITCISDDKPIGGNDMIDNQPMEQRGKAQKGDPCHMWADNSGCADGLQCGVN